MRRSFFPTVHSSVVAGLFISSLMAVSGFAQSTNQPANPNAQTTTTTQTNGPVTGTTTTTTDANGQKTDSTSATFTLGRKKKKTDDNEKIQQTRDAKKAEKKEDREAALLGKDNDLPEKQLFDKAIAQQKSGHYDVARLDLNTLLSTYPDSQYLMQAKLAIADCWYLEGGSGSLAQAEQEYRDFITFFPNSPEASKAQMRIGDIYFKQMDVPDRDYAKAVKAQEAYRTMLKQYPDAPKEVTQEAQQKLREVQEAMATREQELGDFYLSHQNWGASIARYQTVVDTYPQYSHMDEVLIALGDAWEAQANLIRKQGNPPGMNDKQLSEIEAGRSKLEQDLDNRAADDYRQVVLLHAAAPHVEDAKDRLMAMNLPVPEPTAEQRAASEALENSRASYNIISRAELLFLRKPDTVPAARIGDPPLEDPAAVVAPAVNQYLKDEYAAAFVPGAKMPVDYDPNRGAAAAPAAPAAGTAAPATPQDGGAPLSLGDIPAAGQGSPDASTGTMTQGTPSGGGTGTGMGMDVIAAPTGTPASNLPAATGAPDPNYGIPKVAPTGNKTLPAAEAPAAAPDAINEVQGKPQGTTVPDNSSTTANGKKKKKTPKPTYDKDDESSSQHKKKEGLDKLNPF